MANRTVKEAKNIHGTNPQYLIEKIIRSRIYDSKYWKEQCFALTAELLVDKAMELRFVGGVFGGNIKPTQFLCLTLKMLQIQPEKDIVVEFIKNEEFKYVRALGAFYLRLTGSAMDCYKYLEPLYNDNRKLRRQNRSGQYEIVYMDDFIDELLRSDRVCDIILPRVQKRTVLEENNELELKVSALDEDLLDEDLLSDDEAVVEKDESKIKPSSSSILQLAKKKSRRERSRSRSHSRERERDRRGGGGGGGGGSSGGRIRDYNDELEEYGRQRDRYNHGRDYNRSGGGGSGGGGNGYRGSNQSNRYRDDRGGGGGYRGGGGGAGYEDRGRREDYNRRYESRDSRNDRDRRRH